MKIQSQSQGICKGILLQVLEICELKPAQDTAHSYRICAWVPDTKDYEQFIIWLDVFGAISIVNTGGTGERAKQVKCLSARPAHMNPEFRLQHSLKVGHWGEFS